MSGAIHARHWPGDAARPALALHCIMASGAYWGPIADRLGGRVDLRGFDMPDHGRSGPWEREPGVDFHTAVTRIAAAMIDRPVDLIGHSLGATVALRIAVAAPHAVRSLTLIEPVLFAAAPADAARDARDAQLGDLLRTDRRLDAARLFMARWGGPGGLDALPPAAHPVLARQVDLVADTGDTLARDAARILRDGGLEQIDAPVMLIAGETSPPEIGQIIDALATRLADVARATVPDAGHMAPMTHPDQVAGLIAVNLDRA